MATSVINEKDTFTYRPAVDLRSWFGIIYNAPYFLGVDSVGQHVARAFDVPGTVIMGSTFAVNVTYPDFFNIFEKQGIKKNYSPIRISGFAEHLADRLNDTCMDFTNDELDLLVKNIIKDYDKKVV